MLQQIAFTCSSLHVVFCTDKGNEIADEKDDHICNANAD